MAIREGRWDCGYCGTKGNRGRKRKCQHCGAVREKDVRFYLPSKEEAAVLDAALLAQASAGPDWYCEHCGSSNAGGLDACHRCAAPRGSSPTHPVKEHGRPPSGAPASGASTKEAVGPAPVTPPRSAKREGSGCLGCLAVLVITALLIVGISNLVEWRRRPRPFPATVVGLAWKHEVRTEVRVPRLIAGFSWERWINYERLERIRDSGPDVPEGARVLRKYEERGTERRCETRRVHTTKQVRETKRVLSHREETETESYQVQVGTRESTYTCGAIDLGNGFFEDKVCTRSEPVYETRTREHRRQVPVYQDQTSTRDVPSYQDEEHCVDEPTRETRYEYESTEWQPSRTEKTEGQDRKPRWGKARLSPGERESGRHEWLYVLYVDKGTGLPSTQRILDASEWRSLKVGDPVPSVPESWLPGRLLTLESQSRDEREVRWPELAADEREAERKATYTVFLRGEDGKEHVGRVGSLEEWQRYTPGGPATIYLSQGRFVGALPP